MRPGERLFEIHEEWVAENLDAQKTVASGAKHEKSDVVRHRPLGDGYSLLVEAKCTQSASYSVSEKYWRELEERCFNWDADLSPVLAIRFYDKTTKANGQTEVKRDLMVIDAELFFQLLEAAERRDD